MVLSKVCHLYQRSRRSRRSLKHLAEDKERKRKKWMQMNDVFYIGELFLSIGFEYKNYSYTEGCDWIRTTLIQKMFG